MAGNGIAIDPETGRALRRALWLLLAIVLLAGSGSIAYHAVHTPTYTIDSYFYLSKARQLATGHGLHTTWNDGSDPKYFPGYSIFLSFSYLLTDSYIPLQIVCYALCAILLLAIGAELGRDPTERLLAAIAFAANPIVIKWLSLPMAEGVATALCLVSVLLFLRFVNSGSRSVLLAACMLGGLAAITRIESLFLLVVFGTLVVGHRRKMRWPWVPAGGVLVLLPLVIYLVSLRMLQTGGSAYLGELRMTFLRFDLLQNVAYNVWAPFGLMHWPLLSQTSAILATATIAACAVWLALGQVAFIGGLAWSVLGRLGSRIRAVSLLFLVYAAFHAFWYYRYERFMLMAVPLAALVWGAAVFALFSSISRNRKGRWWSVAVIALLVAAAGVFLGNQFSSYHRAALQRDTGGLQFEHIATVVNAVNAESPSPVLTDLGPHLAYYTDAHTYLDTTHGNYWRRAFAPERTLEEMNALGTRLIVTQQGFTQWLAAHNIPRDTEPMFEPVDAPLTGVLIIRYTPQPG